MDSGQVPTVRVLPLFIPGFAKSAKLPQAA